MSDGIYTFAAAEVATLSNWPEDLNSNIGRKLYVGTSSNNYRYYELYGYNGTFYIGRNEPSNDTVTWFSNSSSIDLGTVTSTTGKYTTAVWSAGTYTSAWKAPAAGVYIVSLSLSLVNESQTNRNIYKQLQFNGTTQRLTPAVLYYNTNAGSSGDEVGVTRQIIGFIKATDVN